jgi:hypothetical protein
VFGWLAGYEDVNDAERLSRDPAMRWIVGGKATDRKPQKWRILLRHKWGNLKRH